MHFGTIPVMKRMLPSQFFVFRSPYNAPRTGRVLVNGPSVDLLQFEEETFGLPGEAMFASKPQVMVWDYVTIGVWMTDTARA